MSKQGEFIKNARRKLGLTQKQLADRLNVSDKVISKWEVGDSFPDYMLLPHLAKILQVDVQEILNGEYNVKPNVVAETKEVVYVERKTTENTTIFKDKIIYALKFMYKYRGIFFASFLGLSLILMFCRFFSWEVAQLGFKNSFFKLLFAPFQTDINKYLYGDFVSAMNSQFTTNTNFLVYIISALMWFYLIFLVLNIFKLIKSAVKKENIETKLLFKRTLIYSILTVGLFILSFILKSQFINMFNSSGLNFDNYESMGVGAKTCSVLPMLWSFVVIAFSSVFNYVQIFSEATEMVEKTNTSSSHSSSTITSIPRAPKENVELTPEQKAKREKVKKAIITIAIIICILSVGICGFCISNNLKPSPQNTVKAYLNNLNSSSYDSNYDLLYATNDDDKVSYDTLTYQYMLYNNLSLSTLNIVYENNGFGLYNATITGNYIVSGNSSFVTYKIDIPIYHHDGKYLLLEPLDLISGSSCTVDKTNRCVIKNKELVLYYGNNFNSFRIPEGVTSIKSTFYNNIATSSTYRILYNVNSSNPNTYTRNSGKITLTAPTRNGYEFYGWIGTGISSPQSTVIIDAGSTGNRYYIALWNATYYSITYEDVETNNNPIYYTIEDEVTLSYPEKTGYTFTGWTGTGLNRETANITIPKGSYGDRTYTAHWYITNYTIKYDLGGGDNNPLNPITYNYESNTFTLSEPTKTGYTFTGWTGSNGTTQQKSITIPKGSTGNRTYTANWDINTFTITYDLNSGTINGTNPTTFTVETNSFTLINPTHPKYEFAGWTGSNGTIPMKDITISMGSVGNRNYKANWLIDYTIDYKLNGGTIDGENPTTYTILTEDFTLINPTKTGYTFKGWTGTNIEEPITELSILKGSIDNRIYTANWEIITYNISYESNWNGKTLNNPTKYTIEDEIVLNNPSSNVVNFNGWKLNDQHISKIDKGTTGNLTIIADWGMSFDLQYYITETKCKVTGVKNESITNIIVSESVTEISKGAFSNCKNLESITLPFIGAKVDGTGETHFGYIFGASEKGYNEKYVPTSLKSITLLSTVTKINGYAFYGCSSLKSIDLSNCTNLTLIGYEAFYGCNNLTKVNISSIENWLQIDFVVYDANPLYYAENLYINNELVTESVLSNTVTEIKKYTFSGIGLTSIDLSNCINLTTIGAYAFYNCDSLKSIILPSSVTAIGDSAFSGCKGITSITIPSSVTSIGRNAFGSCAGLNSIMILDGNTVYDSRNNCNAIIETSTNTLIKGCNNTVIPLSVTSIGDYAFYGCSSLTSITIPSSVTSIGYEAFSYTAWYGNQPDGAIYINKVLYAYKGTMKENDYDFVVKKETVSISEYAFDDCNNLTSIDLSNCTSLTTIGSMAFSSCNNLISIDLSNCTSLITIGSQAFEYCYGLTSIDLSNCTSLTTIGFSAFKGCTGLTSIDLSNCTNLTRIGDGAFLDCNKLTKVNISSIEDWLQIDFNYRTSSPLYYAKNLYINNELVTDIVIPSSVTEIGGYSFYNCSNLKSIDLSNCTSLTSISAGAFYGCTGLISIDLSNCINLTTIGAYAFYNCDSLKSITIPSSVTTIGSSAFRYCYNLIIYCKNITEPSGWYSDWNYSNRPVYWYSETQPTTSGNYWHYDKDGETPVIW